VASIWRDLGVSVFLAILGAVLAVLWPWWQDRRRRRRLFALLRRELQEVGPIDPLPGKEWWEHLTKRFLHEELFRRANVSANRDFLLSLHPSLVYHASQLWIAFDHHDLVQWRYHLGELLRDPQIAGHVSSEDARDALTRWESFTEPGQTTPRS
jgi:hypothetical protein